MYQRNPKHNTKRRVRRRPRFVSINEVEAKAAQWQTHTHKHTLFMYKKTDIQIMSYCLSFVSLFNS